MPKRDFIPRQDDAFSVWFTKYVQYVQLHAVDLGLNPGQVNELVVTRDQWAAAYNQHVVTKDAARSAAATKDDRREVGERVLRNITGFIQNRRETTDAQREGLGVTVPDREPTPLDPEAIRHIPPPFLLPDFSQRGQVTIHFGPNPGNELKNALPEIARAVRLQFYIGVVTPGTDVNALPWQWLADDTHSPYLHILNGPVTVSYRAQYIDLNLHLGVLCDPVTVTITA
jgi:hypothetical protein